MVISHRYYVTFFWKIGLNIDSKCGVYDLLVFKCITSRIADATSSTIFTLVNCYGDFHRIYIWSFITFLYLDFDLNDDIFGVVYDTDVISHANRTYHITEYNWIWVYSKGTPDVSSLFINVEVLFSMNYSLIHRTCESPAFWFSSRVYVTKGLIFQISLYWSVAPPDLL